MKKAYSEADSFLWVGTNNKHLMHRNQLLPPRKLTICRLTVGRSISNSSTASATLSQHSFGQTLERWGKRKPARLK